MSVVISLEARRIELTGGEIAIGRSPTAQVSLPSDVRLADTHAVLKLVAGRWLIEALGDQSIRVGEGRPSRMAWLNPGDVIYLTESGPKLTFESRGVPQIIAAPATPVVQSAAAQQILIPAVQLGPATSNRTAPAANGAKGHVRVYWAVGTAAAIVLAAMIAAAVTPGQHDRRKKAVEMAAAETKPVPGASTFGDISSNPPPDKSAIVGAQSRSPAESVYLVLLSAPDRDQTYRLGMAWAMEKRRLVTSAAVAQGIQQLREQLPQATVRGMDHRARATLADVHVHPEYQRISRLVSNLQQELDDLRGELEGSRDDSLIEQLRPKMIDVQSQLLESLHRQVDYDVAVMDVDRDLPNWLPVPAAESAKARPGTLVQLVGFPFPVDEFLLDPEAEMSFVTVQGQVQAKVKGADEAVRHWLVKLRDAKPEENWSGSPVVNSRGEVLGVYSRPTAPLESQADFVPVTHEMTAIGQLMDFRKGLP